MHWNRISDDCALTDDEDQDERPADTVLLCMCDRDGVPRHRGSGRALGRLRFCGRLFGFVGLRLQLLYPGLVVVRVGVGVVIADLQLDLLPRCRVPALVEFVFDSAPADLEEKIDPEHKTDPGRQQRRHPELADHRRADHAR